MAALGVVKKSYFFFGVMTFFFRQRTPDIRSTENRFILGIGKEHLLGLKEEMEGNCDRPMSPLGCSGLKKTEE